jgi:hypothetical protein
LLLLLLLLLLLQVLVSMSVSVSVSVLPSALDAPGRWCSSVHLDARAITTTTTITTTIAALGTGNPKLLNILSQTEAVSPSSTLLRHLRIACLVHYRAAINGCSWTLLLTLLLLVCLGQCCRLSRTRQRRCWHIIACSTHVRASVRR